MASRRTRGQGTFEYVLLLGGVVMFVIVGVLILQGGIVGSANSQIAGSVGTLTQITSACQAISTLIIDANGSNATLTLCQAVDPNSTIVYLYSNPIVFNGSTDQPANMSFSVVDGFSSVFLNVLGKNGTALNMNQTHCADVTVNGTYLVRNLCGTIGTTVAAPTPVPTPTPAIPPTITNVSANPTDSNATVTWNTDTNSNSSVAIGTSPGVTMQTVGQNDNVTLHSVLLAPLSPNRTIYYRVTSCNPVGCNSSSESNFTMLNQASPGAFNNTEFNMSLSGLNPGILVGTPNDAGFTGADFYNTTVLLSDIQNLTGTPNDAGFTAIDFSKTTALSAPDSALVDNQTKEGFASADFYNTTTPTNPSTTLTGNQTQEGFSYNDFGNTTTPSIPAANVTGT